MWISEVLLLIISVGIKNVVGQSTVPTATTSTTPSTTQSVSFSTIPTTFPTFTTPTTFRTTISTGTPITFPTPPNTQTLTPPVLTSGIFTVPTTPSIVPTLPTGTFPTLPPTSTPISSLFPTVTFTPPVPTSTIPGVTATSLSPVTPITDYSPLPTFPTFISTLYPPTITSTFPTTVSCAPIPPTCPPLLSTTTTATTTTASVTSTQPGIDPRPAIRQLPNGCPCLDPHDACRTPDGQTGICMIYINCDSIVRLLMVNAQQRDPNIEDYILQSICGNRQLSQMVCCPGLRFSHGITATSMTTRATTTVKTVTVRPTTAKITTAASSGGIFFFSDLSSAAPNPTTTTALPIPIPNGTYKLPRNSIDRCGMTNASHSRVVGGVDAQLGAWPWMAALGYRSSTYDLTTGPVFLCGGTLITIRHVLTAAHCIQNLLYFVRLGEYDITTTNDGANPVDIYVEKVIVHEQYNEKTIQNDVALIRLQSEAPFTDMIRPICMPVEEPMRSLNLTYYSPFVAGWGTTSFRGPTASRLQEVQVIVLPIDQCAFNYKLYFPDQVFDDKVLCAGFAQGGKDSCQGDSGGPLMLPQLSSNGQYYYFNLIGIVSYGYECAKAGFPGVYVKVSAYIPWIESKLNA